MFITALLTIAKQWKKSRWHQQMMNKEKVVYIHNGDLGSTAGKWTEMEIIVLSKVSQFHKDKYFMFSLQCGI
jgi:hypothetical protein